MSDFSTDDNYMNFYMNDEPTPFQKIHLTELKDRNSSNHILVCASEFNSSVYNFILPLRAQYLQKIQPIGSAG